MVRRRGSTLGLAATLAVAAAFVAVQPLASPWWVYADSDAAYVSSALNVVYGTGTRFFDHPGVPLQELAALTFELRRWASGMPARHAYADGLLLHLDAARPYYRAYGIALFLAGIAVAFALGRRLLGHPLWGAAAGLLVLGAPGLVPMSIQYRADVALPLALLGWALLTAEAARRRDGLLHLAAGLVAGLALTLKLSAAPLLVGLAVAAVWRPPSDGIRWGPAGAWLARRRAAAAVAALAWVAAAVVVNRLRFPFTPTASQLGALAGLAGGAAVCVAVARGFYGWLVAAVVAGILLPVSIDLADGLRMLPWIVRGFTGSGVNDGVTPFADTHLGILRHFPLLEAVPLMLLSLGALAAGIRRRDPVLGPLAAAAVAGVLMASARIVGRDWYFVPGYLLAIPAVLLWLRGSARTGAVAAAALVALAVVPQALHARDPAHAAAAEERTARAAASLRLAPGEVGLTPAEYPTPDTRFFELVQEYDLHVPVRRYRFLPATEPAAALAAARGLRPALALDERGATLSFGGRGYRLEPIRASLPFPLARLVR